jgi:proteasome accessory factor B
LNLGEVSPLEISLLSLASSAWQGASLSSAAQSAFVKLASLGIPIDELDLPGIAPVLPDAGPEIASITRAIAEHRILEFTYLNSELQREVREIVPTGLKSNNGFWYLSGVDQAIQKKRTFRLDRILGDFSVGKVQKDFDFADEKKAGDTYDAVEITFFAIVDVRQGKCAALRVLATDIKRIGEWDQLTIPILNIDTLTSLILWHGEDAFVQQPIELREQIIYRLQSLVSNHA